jgi:GT2 family glycosyltransferase
MPFERAVAALEVLVPSTCEPASETVDTYGLDAAADTVTYQLWLRHTAARLREQRHRTAARLAAVREAPTITVAVPVYRPDPVLLRACVESVLAQSYTMWELCLCDDASDDGGRTMTLLTDLVAVDPRIRVTGLPENRGISEATNAAASLSTGAFVAFLDQDDELEEGVLGDVAEAVIEQPEADVLYTDQDKLDETGTRTEPYFKPGWSPDLLLSNMYLGHLLVVRRSLFERLGGLRSEFDGSQDYDLALRVTAAARRVVHVPVVGYHWRRTVGSTALDYTSKPQADQAARRALAEAMERRGERAVVESGQVLSTFRVRRLLPEPPPLVSVVIPFHDGARLLRRTIDALQHTAGHERWEAILVDNRSWEPQTRALVKRVTADERVRVLPYDAEFNWSAINNWAAERSRGDVLLFMNSDVEGGSDGWMAAMLEHALRKEVGAVGARLLYPDGRIQHAGVVLGLGGGVAWHAFCFCPPGNNGYFGHTRLIRNYMAVTGACLMVSRERFDEVGRFDESLPVAYNDIDFCVRLHQRGYLNVFTPFAELVHYEGATRGRSAIETDDEREMFRRYEPLIRSDPYFNPNLNPRRSEFQLALIKEEDPWARVQ